MMACPSDLDGKWIKFLKVAPDSFSKENMLKMVRKCYEYVYAKKYSKLKEKSIEHWQKNALDLGLQSFHNSKYHTTKWMDGTDKKNMLVFPPKTFQVDHSRSVPAYHQFLRNLEGSKRVQKMKCIPLKRIQPLPHMSVYAPVQRNVLTEDEQTLHHIPYIDDKEDRKFVQDLMSNYEGKMHSPESVLEPDLIAEVVNHLLELYLAISQDNKNNNSLNHLKKDDFIDLVLEKLAEAFPEKVQDDDLKNSYHRFSDYLMKHSNQTPDQTSTPNIDGPLDRIYSFEKTMHSYIQLFCKRCFTYDCQDHHLDISRSRPDMKPKSLKPCGLDCYFNIENLNLDSDDESSTSTSNLKRPMRKRTIYKPIEIDRLKLLNFDETWSNSDKTMYNVLTSVFGSHQRCLIAFFLKKKCFETYAYSKSNNLTTDDELLSDEKISSRKVGKKKTRKWAHHCRKLQSRDSTGSRLVHYYPCEHPGLCNDQCSCVQNKTFCEKFCNCPESCVERYPGCGCRGQCMTNTCRCFSTNRECDPDVCKTCGADQLDYRRARCKNIAIQRGLRKKLLLGVSDVAGWGIFLNDVAEKHDLISEYCGEMITQIEADRRGRIYDKEKVSFLFNLNSEYVIDAKRKGNKIRFANHSSKPNCYARVKMVNGEHRIGIFANEKIEPFEELFFDYSYGPTEKLKYVRLERD